MSWPQLKMSPRISLVMAPTGTVHLAAGEEDQRVEELVLGQLLSTGAAS